MNPPTRRVRQYSAVSDAQDVQAVKTAERVAHDLLVALTGSRRRSDVTWQNIPATDLDHIEALLSGTDEISLGAPQDIRTFLAENPEGALIIAECEAVPD